MKDLTDWLINREESIKYIQCQKCAKQLTCNQEYCTGQVKWSDTKGYGEVKKNETSND